MTPSLKLEPMCFALPSGEELIISAHVLSIMSGFRQTWPFSCEAGGQLFATLQEKRVTITDATRPGILDIRRRFGFYSSRKSAQMAIDKRYEEGLHFVGEWHTHPEPYPTPSGADLDSMKEMVTLSKHALSGYIMLILGTAAGYKGLYASIHCRNHWQRLSPYRGSQA